MNKSASAVPPPEVQALLNARPDEEIPLLIEYLGSDRAQEVALARHVFTRLGEQIVSRLLVEAFARKRRPRLAVRLLDVVANIGRPLRVDDWMLLVNGCASGTKAVRVKCAEVVRQLGHARGW